MFERKSSYDFPEGQLNAGLFVMRLLHVVVWATSGVKSLNLQGRHAH
jgi:hypothetical protein